MSHQDWETVTFTKKKTVKTKQQITRNKNTNIQKSQNTKKLENDELPIIKKISKNLSIEIQQARTAKKLTQKNLAHLLNVKQEVVSSYENGSAILNIHIVRKIEKILNVKFKNKK